jgi:hypothetical protein
MIKTPITEEKIPTIIIIHGREDKLDSDSSKDVSSICC